MRICLSVCVPSFLFLSPHLLDYSSREPSVSSSHPIPASHAQPSYHPPSSNGSGGITEREEVRLSARMFVHCFFRPMSHTLSFSPNHFPSTVIIFTHTFRSFLFFSFFSLFLFIFFHISLFLFLILIPLKRTPLFNTNTNIRPSFLPSLSLPPLPLPFSPTSFPTSLSLHPFRPICLITWEQSRTQRREH